MRIRRREFLFAAGLGSVAAMSSQAASSRAPFTTTDDGKRLTVLEKGKPAFTYNYAQVDLPEGIDAKFRRANYLHPLHSPEGVVVTEDFPKDHYHHRGVFWAWPNCSVNGKKLNVWELDGARSVFKQFKDTSANKNEFTVSEESEWQFDDDHSAPVEELVTMTLYPTKKHQRVIDFALTFRNKANADVVFQGSSASAGTDGSGPKGYGGFCFRPDATNKPFVFTAENGIVPDDKLAHQTYWADISWGADEKRGVAIVQHPDNPGFPHPGWIFRHYGFLGVSWPHNDTHTLKPNESFSLRYRLIVHEGDADQAKIADRAKLFLKQ